MSEYIVGKNPCKRCQSIGNDKSGDNFVFYGEGMGGHCFSCGYSILSDGRKDELGFVKYEYNDEEVMTKEIITPEQLEEIKEYTNTTGQNQRGITDETYKAYKCRFKYDEESGEVTEHFYPYTQGYVAAGYKVRKTPVKDFYSVGKIGKDSELFGQWRWKNAGGKYVLLCAGEIDAMSAYQMLENYRKGRGNDYDPTPVVSSAIGETGSYKQVQLQYEWLNQFERIIVMYDNDDAGREAVKKLVDVIPKGKMFVAQLPLKDVNEMLVKGKEKQFLRAFYDAPAYSPDGIVGSGGLLDRVKQAALTPKIPLPRFMHRVQSQMAGGIPLGVIINLASASGTGKSTIIDECTYFWIFHSPHRVGVLTMESDAGQYGTKILSRHCGVKIDLIEDIDEKIKFLESPETAERANDLFKLPDGQDRWHLIEDRDGGLESVKDLIMELISKCGCKVIICDPVSDLLEGLDNEQQASFCRWMKGVIKSHNVTFVNVTHVRKSGSGQKANSTGAVLHEEDIFGSSSLIKSAACNLLFTRNKEATDDIEKNTTYMKMSKCRWTGKTGESGEYYYDSATHTMYDKEDWFEQNPVNY